MQAQEPAEDIECILPPKNDRGALYIGNLAAAKSTSTLKKFQIEAVVSMAKGGFLTHSQQDLPYYLYIQAQDRKEFDLSPYFDTTFDFIDKYRKKTNVLVHCMAGISRSVTIVIAYLMKKTGRSLVDCFLDVKKSRPVISPNEGFIVQLKKYEEKIKGQKQAINQTSSPMGFQHLYASPHKRKLSEFYLNQSTNLEPKIKPINLEEKLSSLRSKYRQKKSEKNPEKDAPTERESFLKKDFSNKRFQYRAKTAIKKPGTSY